MKAQTPSITFKRVGLGSSRTYEVTRLANAVKIEELRVGDQCVEKKIEFLIEAGYKVTITK